MSYVTYIRNVQSSDETSLVYLDTSGNDVSINGSGFVYDEDGILTSGTITSITYTSSSAEQTVTVDNLAAADLFADLLRPATDVFEEIALWPVAVTLFTQTATRIEMIAEGGDRVVFEGSGLGVGPTQGTVKSIVHTTSAGAVLDEVDGLDVSLGVAMTAAGISDYLYAYLTAGDNTITSAAFSGRVLEGGLGDDILDGSAGDAPLAEYVNTATASIDADLGTGVVTGGAGTDTLIGIGGISGSNFADTIGGRDDASVADELSGNDGDDRIEGLAGNDRLVGGDGNDTLLGGKGNDRINGSRGNDVIDGGGGRDVIDFSEYDGDRIGEAGVTIDLAKSGKQAFGAWGKDTLKSIEGVIGSRFADTIVGGKKADTLSGDLGDDTIRGLGGNDRLDGGSGDDRLDGGKGNDLLTASFLSDLLIGGSGKDVFAFGSLPNTFFEINDLDRVKDFRSKDDQFELSATGFFGMEAGKLAKAAFAVGAEARDDDDRIIYDKAAGKLYFDQDGAGGLDQREFAVLVNKAIVSHTDFLFV
jgi:Ca2+-binding RTX toxin-like protein